VIFGLIAVVHAVRAMAEWPLFSTDPGYYLSMVGLGVLAAALSAWSWRLLRARSSTRP
jgi:hypothetical protein